MLDHLCELPGHSAELGFTGDGIQTALTNHQLDCNKILNSLTA